MKTEYATVEDIAEIMLDLMAQGKEDYVVISNDEYYLAKKGDEALIDDSSETVELGGYID